ncbi:hypothetical protein M0805_006907 [Coniferiporia weirii]|nr:hypothetical protein M0805_006907 [Coniferiporia weirii]
MRLSKYLVITIFVAHLIISHQRLRLRRIRNPDSSPIQVQDYPLPFSNINVWTTVRLRHQDIQGLDKDKEVMDSFHACPEKVDNQGKVSLAHFDTVLVEVDPAESDFQDNTSLDGTRAGRVKIIFSLPRSFTDNSHGVLHFSLHSPLTPNPIRF